jgi:ubiquinone/menaquinone biosynthesis C-methylase UbiE
MSNIYESGVFTAPERMPMHPGGLRLTDRAARLAALSPGMVTADIGCGAGDTSAFLASKYRLRMIGLEISKTMVEDGLKNRPDLELLHWDGGAFPMEDSSLDAAVIECVLSVAGRPGQILRECARCLKKGGRLILSDVVLKHGAAEAGLPTAEDLTKLLLECGFNVAVCEDHTPALRTYVAELRNRCGSGFNAAALLGRRAPVPRLSAVGYALIIARKD